MFPKDSEDYGSHSTHGMFEELKRIVNSLNNIVTDIMKLGVNNSFFLHHEKEKLSILNLKG